MKQRYVHKYIEVHFPRERAKSVAFFHEKGLKARAGSSCYFLYDEKKKKRMPICDDAKRESDESHPGGAVNSSRVKIAGAGRSFLYRGSLPPVFPTCSFKERWALAGGSRGGIATASSFFSGSSLFSIALHS